MWGSDSWGQMLWERLPEVPLLSPSGLVLLALAILLAGGLFWRSRAFLALVLAFGLASLGITGWSEAATITIPYVFANGTIADANEVNANFDVLVVESNGQHGRISSLELLAQQLGSLSGHLSDPSAHHVKTTSFAELTDQILQAQIPPEIARDSELTWTNLLGVPAGFADGIDDDSGGDITSVITSSGLTGGSLAGDVTLGIDAGYVQRRVDGACTAGSSIRAINTDGSVDCEPHAGGLARVVTVSSGQSVQTAIDGITDATASNPYVVRIGPGRFSEILSMKSHVDVEGAGRDATVLTASFDQSGGEVVRFDNVVSSELRDLSIEANQSGMNSLWATGIRLSSSSGVRVSRVIVRVAGTGWNAGVRACGTNDAILSDLDVSVLEGAGVAAVSGLDFNTRTFCAVATGSNVQLRNSRVETAHTGGLAYGVFFTTTGSGLENTATLVGSHLRADSVLYFDGPPPDMNSRSTADVRHSVLEGGVVNPTDGSDPLNPLQNLAACAGTTNENGRLLRQTSCADSHIFTDSLRAFQTIQTATLQILGGSDLSERFTVHSRRADLEGAPAEIEPGTVVCIDPDRPGELEICEKAFDTRVAGIVSGARGVQPGLLMGQEGTIADGAHPVALSGRVYVRADAEWGAISPGDQLASSETPGHARRVATRESAQGAILGKAMTSLHEGRGLVLVLVSLQ